MDTQLVCDFAGCTDTHVRPAVLRFEREATDPPDWQPMARQYNVCPHHEQVLTDHVRHGHLPWNED